MRLYLTQLYRRAEVIAANEDRAEYIVQNVITEAFSLFLEGRGRAAFQEGLYALVRNIALDELSAYRDGEEYAQDDEKTVERSLYSFAPYRQDDSVEAALYARVMREKYPMRRMLMLRYGCGMNAQQIALAMQMRAADVRQRLRLLTARLFRGALGTQIPMLEQRLADLSLAALNRPDSDVPEMTTVFKLFSENLADSSETDGRARRALRAALLMLGGLLCAALFWLISVLLVPGGEPSASEFGEQIEISAADENIFFI
jgi:DNA-directed RNA polymerase specialized sigma24 family protein